MVYLYFCRSQRFKYHNEVVLEYREGVPVYRSVLAFLLLKILTVESISVS